jgi:hypothetical protein
LLVVLYRFEKWSPTQTKRAFETRVLSKIFEPKREEVTGDRRKLHTEQLHALYSPIITQVIKSRRMRWAGHTTRMGRK